MRILLDAKVKNQDWNINSNYLSKTQSAPTHSVVTSTFMKPYTILFSLLFSVCNLSSATATSLLPISLEQLSTRATLIFYGEVLSNQVKQDEKSG